MTQGFTFVLLPLLACNNKKIMPNKLGEVTDQGCYKNGKRVSGAKFLHNCGLAGGNQVIWTFAVLNAQGQVIGHVQAALGAGFQGDESAQKARILQIANGLVPQ